MTVATSMPLSWDIWINLNDTIMKINFDEVMIFSDVARTHGEIKSIRKAFADFIYTQQSGVLARALANKIFKGNNETEYTPEEVELIKIYSSDLPPCYIDAIAEMLAESELENKEE